MTCAVGYDLGRRVGNLHPGRAATRGLLESGLIMACGDHMILDVEAIKVIGSWPGHGLPGGPSNLPHTACAVTSGLGAQGETTYRIAGGA